LEWHVLSNPKTKGIVKRGWSEGKFPPKHSANESFVGISKDCNPMNQTTFVGKKSYGSKSYTIPLNQTSPEFLVFQMHHRTHVQMEFRAEFLF
jgi:hypothetical protein